MTLTNYRLCNRCVMDTTAPNIEFDTQGVCNFCSEFLISYNNIISIFTEKQRHERLETLLENVKENGKNKEYDCIIGVSGGVDSSYTLYVAKELGLRPLAVHMDNNWNSEAAANNIQRLVRGLDIDLYTHVIDWEEYRDLMEAFFAANVIDIEILYDNAMAAVCYKQAAKYGLINILSGTNTATEGMRMPCNWAWIKSDAMNIRAIHKAYGRIKEIKTFPSIGMLDLWYLRKIKGIQWIPFLDYVEYNKEQALEILQKKFSYKPYPFKHYESIFTRFYQGYILPNKFGVDKRKLHFSNLIMSGQMSREEAIDNLQQIPYPSEEDLERDKRYFIKKMGWTHEKLADYINRPARSHLDYASEEHLYYFRWKLNKFLHPKADFGPYPYRLNS